MKLTFAFVLLAFVSKSQCPTAAPATVSGCSQGGNGLYYVQATIAPAYSGSVTSLTYLWACPPGATTTSKSAATLQTNTPGIYTLTLIQASNSCTTVSTHTVSGCPPGTPMVGIMEYTLDPIVFKYFDLFGSPSALVAGRLLIEYSESGPPRKVLVFDPQ